jgi:DNA-binding response OmpR family regulator
MIKAFKNNMSLLKNKILIVEDEPRIRHLFRRCLDEEGFRVFAANSGRIALQILRKEKDFSLVVLDILVPNLGGPQLYGMIRSDFPLAKVIVSSVYPLEDQESLISGADDYHHKSDGVFTLIDKINGLLERSAK